MNEIDIRRKVYTLALKPNTKLTLLGVLQRVNWKSLQGQVSSNDVSKAMNMSASTVRRAFKELIELGYISRTAQRRESPKGTAYHHRAVTSLNIDLIIENSNEVSSESTKGVSSESTKVIIHEVRSISAKGVSSESTNPSSISAKGVSSESTNLLSTESANPTLNVSYNTTEDTTKDISTEENNNNTAEIESPTVSDDTTVMSDISADPKTLDDLNLSDKEAEVVAELKAEGCTEEFLVRAVMNNRRLSAKLNWRYQTEASSTRKETSYDPYKRF